MHLMHDNGGDWCLHAAKLIFNEKWSARTRKVILSEALALDAAKICAQLYVEKRPDLLVPLLSDFAEDGSLPPRERSAIINTLAATRNLSVFPIVIRAAISNLPDLAATAEKALNHFGDAAEVVQKQVAFAIKQARLGYQADAGRILDDVLAFVSLKMARAEAARQTYQIAKLRQELGIRAA